MTAPAYEWPTRTTGPSIAATRVAIDSASDTSPLRGLGRATTVRPAVSSSRITPAKLDASANAPCTRTIVASSDMTAPFEIFSSHKRLRMTTWLQQKRTWDNHRLQHPVRDGVH